MRKEKEDTINNAMTILIEIDRNYFKAFESKIFLLPTDNYHSRQSEQSEIPAQIEQPERSISCYKNILLE